MKTTSEIRQLFLDFFISKGHEHVASSSLIPGNDPSLLFTNAGMVQFKDTFLGLEQRPYVRATTSQRCVRAGGKHNDLENVGYTARHHTFFEMLGNFSFGDYFKEDAIRFAWEFLTEVLQLPADKLWVTVFEEDEEAADIWINKVGASSERFSRIGAKDNFWSMGDTGPCGPCTEIFYDHGPDVAGGPPGSPEEDGDRYIEIWNLVFMQYNRDADGNLESLPKPSVDTGMGLERLVAVLQHVHSNYEIDLFQSLIKDAAAATGNSDLENKSLRVIADHIRSCAFLIADGVLPSNEGRGYVLRRIIRRACRHGHQLGQSGPFFNSLVRSLADVMGDTYPELITQQDHISRVLLQEEQRFAETLDKGMTILTASLNDSSAKIVPGEVVFKLYDTYGFPADLTADVAREHGMDVDMDTFEQMMEQQRERARGAKSFAAMGDGQVNHGLRSEFCGYDAVSGNATLTGIICDGTVVETLSAGQKASLILDSTPFYAESGGPVGDTGQILVGDAVFAVKDTQKMAGAIVHTGELTSGEIKAGAAVVAEVDVVRRQAIVLNHSATHLMHAALRQVLGAHVQQKGSQVTPDRLRFDFSHFEAMTSAEIAEVEAIVNAQIRENSAAVAQVMTMDDAVASGAMALFGEKYGDEVRVMNIGFSTELCGGVHVKRAGDIGLFKIVSESGVAAGVRRIEAMTGQGALEQIETGQALMARVADMLKTSPANLETRLEQILKHERELEKALGQIKGRLAASAGADLASAAKDINGVKVLAANLPDADVKTLRETLDKLKDKLGRAAIVLGSAVDGKVSLVAGVTKAESTRIKAGELVNMVALQVGGKGGGRPDMAQAGGTQPENLDEALESVYVWAEERL